MTTVAATAAKITKDTSVPVNDVDHTALQWVRIASDGECFTPHRFVDGYYRVADPALGRVKHHAANQLSITAEEISDYLSRGYLLRMRGEVSKQVNLIAASEIFRADVPI